jgi:ABC-type uncharacterized transport system fused permease/ATPase subunit
MHLNERNILAKLVKSLIGVIIFDIFLLLFCLILGIYFNILHSFTWFGYMIILLPYSLLAFIISFIYLSKLGNQQIDENNENADIEVSTRMEKFHNQSNN